MHPIATESTCAFGIEFTPGFVREVGEAALKLKIPVSTIRRCQVRYGSISKRPRLQFAVGLVMSSAVYFVLQAAIALLHDTSTRGGRVVYAALFLSLLGAWLVHDAWKKCHYLFVATETQEFHLRLLQYTDESSARVLKEAAQTGSALQIDVAP